MGWKWPFNKEQNDTTQSEQNHTHTETHPSQFETHSSFRSYSTSRSCRNDPEDNNYLICKQKINDGNSTYEKEERVPANTSHSIFSLFPNSFNDEEQLNKLPQRYNHKSGFEEFDKMFLNIMSSPFFAQPSVFENETHSFPFFQQFKQNIDKPYAKQDQNIQNRRPKEANNQGSKYFFSFNEEKDTTIKDI